ncbi:MAG: CYTH domain-containing protein [Oscillospiraceae bacterium]
MSVPMEIERKYLIAYPSPEQLAQLPEPDATEITQTYLKPENADFMRRIRKRGSDAKGWEYTYTQKKAVSFGERIEIEKKITAEQYQELLKEADSKLHTIQKVRYCFHYEGQFFEMDVYQFSDTLATLEIELPSIDTPVRLPEFLHIIADVTGKKGYSNFSLSQNLAFPNND